jgi:hypothetical protein
MRPSLLSTRSASRDRLTLARSDGNGSVDDTGDADARNYYEAASIANLRAQAAAVQNIRSLVPVVLDLLSTHYNRWHVLVVLTLECYILADHVLSAVPHLDVPSWRRMDCVVLSWAPGSWACSPLNFRRLSVSVVGWHSMQQRACHRGALSGQPRNSCSPS